MMNPSQGQQLVPERRGVASERLNKRVEWRRLVEKNEKARRRPEDEEEVVRMESQ